MTHTIAYAYPTSDDARKCGRVKSGAYTVRTGQTDWFYLDDPMVGFDTLDQAKAHVQTLGTAPGPFSLDHPDWMR